MSSQPSSLSFPPSASAIGFCYNPLDRCCEKRDDLSFIQSMRTASDTRFFVFVRDIPVLLSRDGGLHPYFSADQCAAFGKPVREVFLGVERDAPGAALFAIEYEPAPEAAASAEMPAGGAAAARSTLPEAMVRAGGEMVDLRSLAQRGLASDAVVGEMGGAKSVLNWHQRHGFCANCGAMSRASDSGWRRDCPACHTQHFPRVDPVVIMLVVDGDRCLLGRQPRFAQGMYSALAGFVEPGETIDDAVKREVHEEAGIGCTSVRYFASQPWPFPSSLMMGCFARATDTLLRIDTNELEDARWFSRDDVRAMLAGRHEAGMTAPMPVAIAHHLLQAFARNEPISLFE